MASSFVCAQGLEGERRVVEMILLNLPSAPVLRSSVFELTHMLEDDDEDELPDLNDFWGLCMRSCIPVSSSLPTPSTSPASPHLS